MSFLTELEQLSTIFFKAGFEQGITLYADHLKSLSNERFADAVLTLGQEVRDMPYGQNTEFINELLDFVEGETTRRELQDDPLTDIGLASMHMHFCVRTGLQSNLEHWNEEKLKEFREELDIPSLLVHLRKAMYYLTDIRTDGSFKIRILLDRAIDYMYEAILNIRVEDSMPDIDSVYVFLDQIDNDEFWEMVEDQLYTAYYQGN